MPLILLVDDDESFRKMLRLTLTKMGHHVMEARNGKEAQRLFAAEPPDLLLTDIVMPDKEGLEIIDEFRRTQPGVKIVAMSGGGRVSATDYLRIAKMMGANRVLEKPFSNEDLGRTLDDLLGPAPASTPS